MNRSVRVSFPESHPRGVGCKITTGKERERKKAALASTLHLLAKQNVRFSLYIARKGNMSVATSSPASSPLSTSTLPSLLGTSPNTAVLDSFRIAIANQLINALPDHGLTLEKAYEGVDFGRKGVDFTVALPRFRLGGKPEELAKKVAANVSSGTQTMAFQLVGF